jgi:hypothetical protein
MSDPRSAPAARRTAWLAGLALGVLDGFLGFEFPTLALVLVILAAVLLARQRPWRAGIGGLLIGAGSLWLVVLFRAVATCRAFDAVPNQGCVMPAMDGFLIAAGVVALVGLALTAASIRSPD